MKDLIALSFTIYSSIEGPEGKQFLRDMIAIEGKVREYPNEPAFLMPKEQREEEESKGLYNISFYLTRAEFTDIVEGRSSSANDITHNLRAFGELWTFYDLDFPARKSGGPSGASVSDSGLMKVPYVNVSFPVFCQRIILKAAKQIWKSNKGKFDACVEAYPKGLSYEQSDAIQKRHSIKVSQERRNRWEKLYGCGKGSVDIVDSEETRSAFKTDMQDDKFVDMFARLRAIAANSTYAFFQTATLRINKEYGGKSYGWAAYRPNGRVIMNGGLILHEGSGWSIHT